MRAGGPADLLKHDQASQVLAFERAGLVFIFNFDVSRSLTDYCFWVSEEGTYCVLLSSDSPRSGGFDRRRKCFSTKPMSTS